MDDGTVNPGWIARLSGFFFLELMPGGSQEGRRLEEGQGLCETSSEERILKVTKKSGNPSQQPENEEPKSWLELISTEERNLGVIGLWTDDPRDN